MVSDLITALANLDEKGSLKIVEERLKAGENAFDILIDARKSMDIIGKYFEDGEYFIPDLIYSGAILKRIKEIVQPKLTQDAGSEHLGKFVLGTVAGDIHDIGKNIVAFMLDSNGFKVYDLGIDVPEQTFVDKIREVKPEIVGLSGFLTLAFDSMKKTIDAIKDAGLRDRVKIMIGGGQIDELVLKYTGADAYRPDAATAAKLAKEWVGGK